MWWVIFIATSVISLKMHVNIVFLSHFLLYFSSVLKEIWTVAFYSVHISDAVTACFNFSDGTVNYIATSYTLSLWPKFWPCSPGFTLVELKVHCPLWQWGELHMPGTGHSDWSGVSKALAGLRRWAVQLLLAVSTVRAPLWQVLRLSSESEQD